MPKVQQCLTFTRQATNSRRQVGKVWQVRSESEMWPRPSESNFARVSGSLYFQMSRRLSISHTLSSLERARERVRDEERLRLHQFSHCTRIDNVEGLEDTERQTEIEMGLESAAIENRVKNYPYCAFQMLSKLHVLASELSIPQDEGRVEKPRQIISLLTASSSHLSCDQGRTLV